MSKTDSPIEVSNETFDKLIKNHIEKMWGGLEMGSVQYFIETGRVNGNFRLRLISLMKFYQWEREKLSPKEDQQPSRDIRELSEVGELDSYINALRHNSPTESTKILQELFWNAIDAIRKNQPKDQQPSGDIEIRKSAIDYTNKQFVDYGDLTNMAETQIRSAFIAGAKWANTQPIKEDTPIDDDVLKVLEKCKEYFDGMADADFDSERYRPNNEMKLASELTQAFEKLKKHQYEKNPNPRARV